ncbi:hypothetical protein [Roseimarinus sediminis]|uniref:hypothetical protein n=1 Tax=Roseimarinus sediminis TaxID=1610899 RepID=UPI003D23F0D4
MRKKSGFTTVEQAIVLVPEFEKVVRKLEQQVVLRGQSMSTLQKGINPCHCPGCKSGRMITINVLPGIG